MHDTISEEKGSVLSTLPTTINEFTDHLLGYYELYNSLAKLCQHFLYSIRMTKHP